MTLTILFWQYAHSFAVFWALSYLEILQILIKWTLWVLYNILYPTSYAKHIFQHLRVSCSMWHILETIVRTLEDQQLLQIQLQQVIRLNL